MDAKALRINFGRRVRSLRGLNNLTQEKLAEKASISPEYVGKIERGEASPSFKVITSLAKALRVRPVDLFDFSETGGRHL